MFGKNARFKKGFVDAPNLVVNDVFTTIQGEGPYAGQPALFIRLAQCNLACTFCDTEFETGTKMMPQELMGRIRSVSQTPYTLVVITGGEPLLQDMSEFLEIYHRFHPSHQIQIETAGTVWQEKLEEPLLMGWVDLVVSPKTPIIHQKVRENAMAFKYIVKANEVSDDDGLPDYPTQPGLTKRVKVARPHDGMWDRVYVQPCDEQDEDKNRSNVLFASHIAIKFNYTLCLQIHKIINLP